jgi:KipI family sensor histidine kinase inhibitor
VPTYRSLSLHYDPLKLECERLKGFVTKALESIDSKNEASGRLILLPVLYGGEYGPDIQSVSEHTGLCPDEIIRRHASRDCYCYMLGFSPGFGYLGGMDEALATPRLKKPRARIPAGSVGIAGAQTGVYSMDSPGGWQLIGRTPVKLFDPDDEENLTLIEPGDRVRFCPISRGEYESISRGGKYTAGDIGAGVA